VIFRRALPTRPLPDVYALCSSINILYGGDVEVIFLKINKQKLYKMPRRRSSPSRYTKRLKYKLFKLATLNYRQHRGDMTETYKTSGQSNWHKAASPSQTDGRFSRIRHIAPICPSNTIQYSFINDNWQNAIGRQETIKQYGPNMLYWGYIK